MSRLEQYAYPDNEGLQHYTESDGLQPVPNRHYDGLHVAPAEKYPVDHKYIPVSDATRPVYEGHLMPDPQKKRRFRILVIALVAVIIAITALAAGLGVGLTRKAAAASTTASSSAAGPGVR